MSKENVKNFYDALARDAALADELAKRTEAVIIAFAAEKGFDFTAEELAEDQAELAEEDLDQVNGGSRLSLSAAYERFGKWRERSRTS